MGMFWLLSAILFVRVGSLKEERDELKAANEAMSEELNRVEKECEGTTRFWAKLHDQCLATNEFCHSKLKEERDNAP
jgi:hypothetical protein